MNVASPVAGRLDKLLVQRGQTVEAKSPLFSLETEHELAEMQEADEQFKAAQAQLDDLKTGRRKPEVAVTQAQLAQAKAAQVQAALQLKRDKAQFDAGGIPRGQLEDSRANHAIKAARVKELEGQLDVTRLPAREDQIRAQSAQVAAARAVQSQAAWRLDQKRPAASQRGLISDTLYREGEWVAAGSPVVRLLPLATSNFASSFRKRWPATSSPAAASTSAATAAAPASLPSSATFRTSRSSRRRSSTATRRGPSWCSWSKHGRRPRTQRGCVPGNRWR